MPFRLFSLGKQETSRLMEGSGGGMLCHYQDGCTYRVFLPGAELQWAPVMVDLRKSTNASTEKFHDPGTLWHRQKHQCPIGYVPPHQLVDLPTHFLFPSKIWRRSCPLFCLPRRPMLYYGTLRPSLVTFSAMIRMIHHEAEADRVRVGGVNNRVLLAVSSLTSIDSVTDSTL